MITLNSLSPCVQSTDDCVVFRRQLYQPLWFEPYAREDGSVGCCQSWATCCTTCGLPFVLLLPRDASPWSRYSFEPNRRCQLHKRPGHVVRTIRRLVSDEVAKVIFAALVREIPLNLNAPERLRRFETCAANIVRMASDLDLRGGLLSPAQLETIAILAELGPPEPVNRPMRADREGALV